MKSGKMNKNRTNKLVIISFILLTAASVALCALALKFILTDKNKTSNTIAADKPTTASVKETVTETPQISQANEKKHESPVISMKSEIGRELTDINAILNKDSNNTYNISLSSLANENEKLSSFVFIIKSEDGNSDMGEFIGAFGISLKPGCEAVENANWYQSPNISVQTRGTYAEIKWEIPDEIKDYIDMSGQLMFGYWWSDVPSIRLDIVVCNKTCELPVSVDGQTNKEINRTINYKNINEFSIPASDLIGEKDTVTAVTYNLQANDSLGKLSFELAVKDRNGVEQRLEKAVIYTDSPQTSATWILPGDTTVKADADSTFFFRYWWSNCSEITITSVDAAYTNDGTPSLYVNKTTEEGKPVLQEDELSFPTAAEIVKKINVGWNLGNSLDSHNTESDDTETGWGNPHTTKKIIDTVKKAGFNTIRIPVTWYEHMESGIISKAWLDRVQEVVDYAISDGMYVIINVHHDDKKWLYPTYAQKDDNQALFTSVWKQISEKFISYDEHLIFEGMNELYVDGTGVEWEGGTDEERDVINSYLKSFVDTVRSTGGNNAQRILVITTHAASVSSPAVNGLVVPDDDRLILSVHNYAPWYFAGTEEKCTDSDWGTDVDKSELDDCFDMLKNKFINRGIPVIIGEFGADNKNNTKDRCAWFEYYIRAAKKRGIKCIVWDNGNPDEYGLLDRNSCNWHNPDIINAIIDGAQ